MGRRILSWSAAATLLVAYGCSTDEVSGETDSMGTTGDDGTGGNGDGDGAGTAGETGGDGDATGSDATGDGDPGGDGDGDPAGDGDGDGDPTGDGDGNGGDLPPIDPPEDATCFRYPAGGSLRNVNTLVRVSTLGAVCEVPLTLTVSEALVCVVDTDDDLRNYQLLGLAFEDIEDQECDLGVTFDFDVLDLIFLGEEESLGVTVPMEGGLMSEAISVAATTEIVANEDSSPVVFEGALPIGEVEFLPDRILTTWADTETELFEKDVGGSFAGFNVVVNFRIIGLDGTVAFDLYDNSPFDTEQP